MTTPNGTGSALSEAFATRKAVLTARSASAVGVERRNASPARSSAPTPGPRSPRAPRAVDAINPAETR
ncbi:hypothetical protein IOD16_17125 [Saccharothrix sp. 6-C]|uniref:hypothetical protein n=1 Tax=Saccharothrix sp. 6-C TaxID=2781735 RepID=UPI001916FAD3|nr:hypothetical protein [Saccharothrix sp. 6-C]QQQ79957.1 hypothetical protein IOD16_17125 [Saccharothrix sp. 6-C]